MSSESKIRIKLGPLEVDYEGTDGFIKEQLPALLKTLQDFRVPEVAGPDAPKPDIQPPRGQLSTNTIAQKLGAKSGGDLVRAAAARLGIALGKATFTRKELHDEMKTATSYYKKSMANNLDKYIKAVVDSGTLHLQADGLYSLSASGKTALEQKLA
jgi:hypothetical protein